MIKTINVQTFKQLYDANPNVCLIDVREQHEWDEAHIPRALHCPKDTLIAQIDALVPDRNTPIYLHCRGGVRSYVAAEALFQHGYLDVTSVDGGLLAWQGEGYPVASHS